MSISKFFEYILSARFRINGLLLKFFLWLTGCSSGSNLKCLRLPVFRDIPRGNIRIGNNVVIGRGVTFEIARPGNLVLGNEIVIGDNVKLSTTKEIRMGDWSGIAENSSIRGSGHELKRSEKYMLQSDIGGNILIGKDVLIGAGVVVLSGVDIPDGAVIGAQSLVNQHDKLHPYGIFAGSPLKHIRDRI